MRFGCAIRAIVFAFLCVCLHPYIGQATGMEFVYVQGGCYRMGDVHGDGEPDEKPVHEVCVDSFFMGRYEVTQGQWREIMGYNPSYFEECGDDCPVESISWHEAQEFIKRMNHNSDGKYRLPTEAEWEYAARSGGKNERWAASDDESVISDYAWNSMNSKRKTHPVGQKKPNGLGLFDMLGNVWEWTQDSYSKNSNQSHSKNNPLYEEYGDGRVLRGGSWYSELKDMRASNRYSRSASHKSANIGFRVVKTP